MIYVLASDGLAPWGQTAGIILGLYLFISIILGLVVAVALMFLFAWMRDKIELVNKLRPFITELNSGLQAGQKGEPLPTEVADNKIVQVAAQVPKVAASLPARASAIEQKVEQGSDNVAKVVIEVRARTEMVKGMARAFLLPGQPRSRTSIQRQRIMEYEREQARVQSEEVQEEQPRYEEEMIIRQ